MKLATTTLAAAALAVGLGVSQAQAIPVAKEIQLLVDVSGSIDGAEFALQRDGYVAAFQNAAIQAAIASFTGGIAVQYIYWSSSNQQNIAVGWTHLTDAASANLFATAIAAAPRPFFDLTAPGSAINFAVPLFTGNGYEGTDLIIDVSGDGEQNDGADTATARDAAAAAGIQINGLPIGGAGLQTWYQNNVVTTDGFLVAAADFADFAGAVTEKIGREVDIPEPAGLTLLGLGLAALGFVQRKKA